MFSASTCLSPAPATPPPRPGSGWFTPAPPVATGLAAGPGPVRVHLVLVWGGRLLFARRAASGVWGFPSGVLRPGESAVDGACRIGAEQVLVELARPAVRVVYGRLGAGTPGAGAGLFVRASRFRGIPLVVDPRQTDRLAWSEPAVVPRPCGPGVAEAAAACGGRYAADAAGQVPGSPAPVRRRSPCLVPGLGPGTVPAW